MFGFVASRRRQRHEQGGTEPFCSICRSNSNCFSLQEVKALAMVLERTPYPVAVELAATAARRSVLSLQPWLQVRA